MDYTEEEQLERLKEWWKKNGKFVIAGVVLGLGTVIGMRLWTDSRNQTAEAASLQYEQLLQLVDTGKVEEAEQLAGTLFTQYSSTPYATLAKLILARLKVEQGDLAAAEALLRQVMEGAEQEAIREIARMRLARVLLAENKPDAAMALLEEAGTSANQADLEAIKGDIYLAQGKRAEARAAYERALALGGRNQRLLQMRLDDLAALPADAS